jgi:Spy/CpxP family protein refolding chaperone
MNNQSMLARFTAPRRALTAVFTGLALCVLVPSLSAQADNGQNGGRRSRGGQDNGNGNGQDNGGRRNFNPEDMQARMLTAIRERFGISNDEEWALISQRITKVMELRRTTGGGMGGGFRGGPGGPGGDTQGRGGRMGRGGSNSQETEALQQALTDKMPDAEIKARMDRLRDTRKAADAKLREAQEELRAVLTVPQEATAVLFGFLP